MSCQFAIAQALSHPLRQGVVANDPLGEGSPAAALTARDVFTVAGPQPWAEL